MTSATCSGIEPRRRSARRRRPSAAAVPAGPRRPREFRLTTAAELAGRGRPPAARRHDDLGRLPARASRSMHPQYGIGRIVAIDGAGPNRKGRVAFTVGGERTFILAKSPLRPVTGR